MDCSLAALKVIALLARRPDISRAEFRSHYEEQHVPLAREVFEGWPGYVRNHIDRVYPPGDLDFDVVTLFWYRDEAQFRDTVTLLNGPQGAVIREDERRFMGKETNRYYTVREWSNDPDYATGCPWLTGFRGVAQEARKVLALVPGPEQAGWRVEIDGFAGAGRPEGLVTWVGNQVPGAAAEFAEITELWFADSAALERAVARWQTTYPAVTFAAVTARE